MKVVRNILLFLLCLISGCEASFAQTPVSPVQLTTNTPYLEPSTGLHWYYNGATYLWYKALGVKDSTYYITPYYFNHHTPFLSPLTFSYGFTGQPFSFNGSSAITTKVDSTVFQTIANLNPRIASYGNGHYLNLSGSNANQNIGIGDFNFTASQLTASTGISGTGVTITGGGSGVGTSLTFNSSPNSIKLRYDNGVTPSSRIQVTGATVPPCPTCSSVGGNPNFNQLAYVSDLASRDTVYSNTYLQIAKSDIRLDTIAKSITGHSRNDASSTIKLLNGNLLIAYGKSGTSGVDVGQYSIYCRQSTDNGQTWGAETQLIAQIDSASEIPSLQLKSNGNFVCTFFVRVGTSTIPSKLYRSEFTQTLVPVGSPSDITPSGITGLNYYPVMSDRIFVDSVNNNTWLYPYPNLLSGSGVSNASIYEGRMLISTDEGTTWTDAGLSIGSDVIFTITGFGGATEPGVYYTPKNGLVYYFRTLVGSIYGAPLTYSAGTYSAGVEAPLFSAANATPSIKYWSQKGLLIGVRTRLNYSDFPVNSGLNFLDMIISQDSGSHWDESTLVDYIAPSAQVLEPMLYIDNSNQYMLVNYSKTFAPAYSLYSKKYPSYLIEYPNNTVNTTVQNGFTIDYNRHFLNGDQTKYFNSSAGFLSRVTHPAGATFMTFTSSTTGALQITCPTNVDALITIRGHIWQFGTSKSTPFEITFRPSALTANTTAVLSAGDNSMNLPVSFYTNGTTPEIYIGTLSTVWGFMGASIDEIDASRTALLATLNTGWNISIVSSFTGTLASTITNVLPYANQSQVQNQYVLGTNVAVANTDTRTSMDGKFQAQITARMTNPLTTAGDIVYSLASGVPQRLAAGTSTQVLHSGTVPSWSSVATGDMANNAVTYAKMQALSTTSKLLGSSSTTTAVQEITLGTNLSMSGTTLNAVGGVSTVSNSDGSLIISPTSGSVVASLNTAHANTWTATQLHNNTTIQATGESTSSDGMGPINVTIPLNGSTYAGFGVTRLGGAAYGIGVNTVNSLVIGTGTTRNNGATIDTTLFALGTNGNLAIKGSITTGLFQPVIFPTSSFSTSLWTVSQTANRNLYLPDVSDTLITQGQVVRIIARITGINALTTGSTTLYTVPGGRTLTVKSLDLTCTGSSSVSVGPSYTLTASSSGTIINTQVTGMTTNGQTYEFPITGLTKTAGGAELISLNITGGTGTSQTVTAVITGYFN